MITSSEIGPDGEVRFTRPPADQRFVEPYSGLYFQISGAGADTFPSRSLWDRRLRVDDSHSDVKPHLYDSNEFSAADHPEPIRVAERDVTLPGSKIRWRYQIAQSRETIDDQIHRLRSTLIWSFSALGLGLLARAIGRGASAQARATVWDSLEAVQRAVDRLYEGVTVDIAGDHQAQVRVERQDLDEMLGNLVENAAKYGGGRVFVTVEPKNGK